MVRTPRLLALAVVVALAGCDALGGDDPAVVSGTVVHAETSRPITGATVQVRPLGIEMASDSVGAFVASLALDSTTVVEVTAFKTGFRDTVLTTTVEPGQALTLPALALAPTTGDDGTSGPAASITLAPRSSQAVAVSEAGGTETASLVFVAKDADDRPVDGSHAVDIAVSILRGPGGGEFLSPAAPATVRTDENGEATVTLTSGQRAGVVQVETRATVGDREVRSQPITLVIHGGLPSQDHLTVGAELLNYPLLGTFGREVTISALVGDRYANPVQPGTQVYFTTDSGVIGGSSTTDAAGRASVALLTGNPAPPDGDGWVTVSARTSGADGEPIEADARVLLTGAPQVVLETDGLGLGTYRYTVSDGNGHPLAAGNQISVTVDGENVVARGALSTTLRDEVRPGPDRTAFQFTVSEDDPEGEEPGRIDEILIEVTGPNGTVRAQRTRGEGARRAGVGALVTGRPVVGRMPHER